MKFRVYTRCLAFCILKKIKLFEGVYTVNDDLGTSESSFSASPGRFNYNNNNKNPSNESGAQLVFNQQYKQAAYQYHLLFQTKSYTSVGELVEIGALVNGYLKNVDSGKNLSGHYNLSGLIELSKELEKILFKDKYFLF